mmetsp:Transcript_5278/g.8667  ORF Transcript_5278/g.8667 Transcript_5278/m.8667 type:complete len:260 (+) Transcript_5278:3074-3853(+)
MTKEQLNRVWKTFRGSLQQRTQRRVSLFSWGALFQQQTHDIVMTLVCCNAQRRPASVGAFARIRSVFEQSFDSVRLPMVRRGEQRCLSPLIQSMYISSILEQLLDCRQMTILTTSTCLMQRSAKILCHSNIDRCSSLEKQRNYVVVSFVSCKRKSTPSSFTAKTWVCPMFKKGIDRCMMPIVGCDKKRRFPPLVASVSIRTTFEKQIQDLQRSAVGARGACCMQRCVQIIFELAVDTGTLSQTCLHSLGASIFDRTLQV